MRVARETAGLIAPAATVRLTYVPAAEPAAEGRPAPPPARPRTVTIAVGLSDPEGQRYATFAVRRLAAAFLRRSLLRRPVLRCRASDKVLGRLQASGLGPRASGNVAVHPLHSPTGGRGSEFTPVPF